MPIPMYRDIVKAHKPRGYKLVEGEVPGGLAGQVSARTIMVQPIVDHLRLFVFLHECGHVHCHHMRQPQTMPAWREEYEADQYALRALRAAGLPMDRGYMYENKRALREIIVLHEHQTGEHIDDEEVLRYAFGSRGWRAHV